MTGVSYVDAGGRARELTADVVVLACFALENTRLLLLSEINGNGEVGKRS